MNFHHLILITGKKPWTETSFYGENENNFSGRSTKKKIEKNVRGRNYFYDTPPCEVHQAESARFNGVHRSSSAIVKDTITELSIM